MDGDSGAIVAKNRRGSDDESSVKDVIGRR